MVLISLSPSVFRVCDFCCSRSYLQIVSRFESADFLEKRFGRALEGEFQFFGGNANLEAMPRALKDYLKTCLPFIDWNFFFRTIGIFIRIHITSFYTELKF